MAKNGLESGIHRASISGSFKTRANIIQQAHRFVDALKASGHGVQKWCNLTNKHMAAATEQLKSEGLKDSTVIQYLSSARQVALAYDNGRLSDSYAKFDLQREDRTVSGDKSANQALYEEGRDKLYAGDDCQQRLGVQVEYMREMGLRAEEARKLDAVNARIEKDPTGQPYIKVSDGTKGGKERWVPVTRSAQTALEKGQALQEKVQTHNLMPREMSERQWRNYEYNQAKTLGWSKTNGCTFHALRHSFAQNNFERVAGFQPPCKFETKEAYWDNAIQQAGSRAVAEQKHEQACRQTENALGHGAGREDIRCVYTGRA